MSHPILKLVWVNEGILVARRNNQQPPKPKVIEQPPRGRFLRGLDFLNHNGGVIGALTMLAGLIGIVWAISAPHSRFLNLEETINGKAGNPGLNKRVETIDANLSKLTEFLTGKGLLNDYYRQIAIEQGFKADPAIAPLRLVYRDKPPPASPPQVKLNGDVDKTKFDLTITLEKITEAGMHLGIDGRIGTNEFTNVGIVVLLRLNEPILLPHPVSLNTGQQQVRFFVQVLTVHPENLAVLAVGPKDPGSSKKA